MENSREAMRVNEYRYGIGYYLRHYTKTLYLVSLILARRRWNRMIEQYLYEGCFAQAGYAKQRADEYGVEIRQLLKKFPHRSEQ